MPIQIEVQDEHAKLLINFYLDRLKTLHDEIIEREKETKNINATIQKLKRGNQFVANAGLHDEASAPMRAYSEKWPWSKKVQFAIEFQQKALSTKEIVETLSEFEPAFIFDRKRAVASVSSLLSSKSGPDKDFIRYPSESGDFVYDINRNAPIIPELPSIPAYNESIGHSANEDSPF